MKKIWLLISALIFIIIGVFGFIFLPYFNFNVDSQQLEKSFSSFGEQIYFSGRGEDGRIIPYNYGPNWLRMHGGGCSACHGDNGEGGLPLMMSNKEASSITWESLTEEEHMEGEDQEEHPPYDKSTIKRAIKDGLDPAGEPLDNIMPRWQMNKEELDAIVIFLKDLD